MPEVSLRPAARRRTITLPQPQGPKIIPYTLTADAEPEQSRWLWYPYIPAGKLTFIEGDPGIGKSWVTCAIASAISKGEVLPGATIALPPQKVLMASAEDGLRDTIVPRLKSLGANLENIAVLNDVFTMDKENIKDLGYTMKSFAATVLFIDPLVAYLGGKMDMHKANEVRPIMTWLAQAAEMSGCSIVVVRHLRKAKGGKAIFQGIGSIDFTAAVRSSLMVQKRDDGVTFISHIKSNNAPKGKAIIYNLKADTDIKTWIDNGAIVSENLWEKGSFSWGGTMELGEDTDSTGQRVSLKSKSVEREQEFLFELLRDGPMSAVTVWEKAQALGLAKAALNRAKKGVAYSYKTGDGWFWALEERAGIEETQRAKELIRGATEVLVPGVQDVSAQS